MYASTVGGGAMTLVFKDEKSIFEQNPTSCSDHSKPASHNVKKPKTA